MNKKNFKPLLIVISAIIGVLIIGCIAWGIIVTYAFGGFDKTYNIDELVANYNKKSKEIKDVREYFNSIMPKHKKVDIEFEDIGKISRLEIESADTGKNVNLAPEFLDWNLSYQKADSILTVLGWTTNSLNILKEKLDNANCISIASGEPCKIGFKRSGMGMYFFNVFDKPIPDKLRARYNDSCTYIYVNKKLILEYGGGAVGSQCFFNKRR
ncbi:MAG: hypothetical protein JWP94_2322 [Mucilaginibacter sp.]|nr:hypothetical protein [Mucilaginibacter sp.]